jgi:hypothetical protein
LGEPVAKAKARSGDYAKRYGAVEPIFEADPKGLIIMECWQAPPEMLTYKQAVALGKELLSPELRKVEPKPQRRDGNEQSFLWGDGTMVVLRAFEDRYISVEVRAKEYKGPGC